MKTIFSYLSLSLLISVSACAMENTSLEALREQAIKIKASSLMKSHEMGNLDLYHDDQGFCVVKDNNEIHRVKSHDVDSLVKKLNRTNLSEFQKAGYIKIKRAENGEYALDGRVRGNGGFLLTGVIVHQACRVIGYTGLVMGSITTVAAGAVAGGPAGAFMAASTVISASAPAAAAIESGALAIGVAASWIPVLP